MNILHFLNLEIQVKTLTSTDVAYLKTNLLKSSKFQKFEISFRESTIDESLNTLIGEPYRNFSDVKKVWYFRIANRDDYMHIMPYAYEHLTDQQRRSIQIFNIVTIEDYIQLSLSLKCPLGKVKHDIIYNKYGEAITTVKFGKEESPPIRANFVDVFLEDLYMLLKHPKSVLLGFFVNFQDGNDEDCAKICERLEMISRSRTLSFQVIQFIRTTVHQAMSIVEHLDRSKLLIVWLRRVVDPKNFEQYRKQLKNVKISDDDKNIEFTFPNIKITKTPRKGIQADPSLKEIVVRSVFESCLPMKLILRNLQCFDIENLRKVNRGIRECVALIEPSPHIENYSICFYLGYKNGILRTFIDLENGEFKNVEYGTLPNQVYLFGGPPLPGTKHIVFPGTDYEAICLDDIERTLNYQKECMKELVICSLCTDLCFENFQSSLDTYSLFRKIGDVLRRRKCPIRTKKLSMGAGSQMEVMNILPAVDTTYLKIIEFLYPSSILKSVNKLPLQVDQLSQTSQWNNAEHLISNYMTLTTPIQDMNILHFTYLEIQVKTLSSDDVAYLQTSLLKSSNFQKFEISFRESTINESLNLLIGEPYRNFSNVKKVWYFRIPTTDDYMHIVLKAPEATKKFKFMSITLTRVAKEDTPFFN
ncbi:unnamed protein product [Caenorhabditis nigoni]